MDNESSEKNKEAEMTEDNASANKEKKQKPKSFLETVREIDAAERKAALEEEAIAAAETAKREQQQRKAYESKLRQERIELMKLKQGVIGENEIQHEEEVKKTYTVWEKISNFFYHNKIIIILGVMFAALAVFLIHDYVTAERPDISSLFIAEDYDMSYYSGELTDKWSVYCPDHNGDKRQLAKLYYIPTGYGDNSRASMYLAQSDRTKLIGEFQSGSSVMIIGDKKAYQSIGMLEGGFYDCRELFPGDPYAEELGYRLAGTDFKELIGYEDMDDSQLYVSFRTPLKTMSMSEEKMQVNFDHAVSFWRDFIKEHRVDGLTLPETVEPEPLPDDDYYDYDEE